MKILIVSYFFPPYNTIGALRVGKMAKYLNRLGHDVRVLTANNQPLPSDLPLEIPERKIIRTMWYNVNWLPEALLGGRRRVAYAGYESTGRFSKIFDRLGMYYKTLFNFPDGQVGWYPHAVAAGRKLIREWVPDIIYASASPVTSLLVASRLSKSTSIPWVAELRDLWVDNHYYPYGPIRRMLEGEIERRVLQSAAAFVTVSQPLAEQLAAKYGTRTVVIHNGYDEDDVPVTLRKPARNKYIISYTGTIIKGKRDPSVLFRAMKRLPEAQNKIEVHFFGKYMHEVRQIAKQYDLSNVIVHGALPYAEALEKQMQADVLLLLLWDNPMEKGVYTGKLFEYLAAKKPILVVGPKDNVASRLVERGKFGKVISSTEEAEKAIKCIVEGKFTYNGIDAIRSLYTRKKQAEKLSDLLSTFLPYNNAKDGAGEVE